MHWRQRSTIEFADEVSAPTLRRNWSETRHTFEIARPSFYLRKYIGCDKSCFLSIPRVVARTDLSLLFVSCSTHRLLSKKRLCFHGAEMDNQFMVFEADNYAETLMPPSVRVRGSAPIFVNFQLFLTCSSHFNMFFSCTLETRSFVFSVFPIQVLRCMYSQFDFRCPTPTFVMLYLLSLNSKTFLLVFWSVWCYGQCVVKRFSYLFAYLSTDVYC